MKASDRPMLLLCNQCKLTRVLDNPHEAKARAELHAQKSKHYDFELIALEECPGRSPHVHRRGMKVVQQG